MSHATRIKVWTILQWLCVFIALAVFMLPAFYVPLQKPILLSLTWCIAGNIGCAAGLCRVNVILANIDELRGRP